MIMKKISCFIILIISIYVLVGCRSLFVEELSSAESASSSSNSSDSEDDDWDWDAYMDSLKEDTQELEEEIVIDPAEVITELDADEMFTNNELTLTYDESSATKITLSNESVTIDEEGTYILSGTLTDGQIIVDVSDSTKVHLVLDNVEISSSSSAAIYVKEADKVFITLADNSYNILSTTGEYVDTDDEGVDGVIYSKADISFMGSGTLEITTEYGHGIVGKDDVVFTSGNYVITASSHGINANDSVRILDGTFTINSGKDGIQVENNEDFTKGYVYIAGGTFDITAEQDGITASSLLQIDGGELLILSGGGFVEVLNEITMGEGSGNMSQATDSLAYSMKGLKAFNILVNDGNITILSYEDAVHANNDLTFNGGTVFIQSGDDALHADSTLTINDMTLEIDEAYEGIEGLYIYINGGDLIVNVYDDAINATDSSGHLTITDGNLSISCVGDGLDSNGDLIIEGGYIIIDCNPIYSGGDGEIDVSGSVTYTGGTIVDADGNDIDPSSGFSSSSSGNSFSPFSNNSQSSPSSNNSGRK